MKRHLCLNSIVRNESARMVRMLDSVKDHITTFAILDTGSTDDTVAVIEKWAVDNGINGIVARGAFVDFSQARNDALMLARSWWKHPNAPKFSYLLLVDADMQLVVEDLNAFANLLAPSYELVQKAGGMSYNNIRLIHVAPQFKYVGVTHEYLDCGGSSYLAGAYFVDHADGANRPEKFERDIRLLRADLDRDPQNPRSWYYLASTYRDAGDNAQAVAAFRYRIGLGGWDEEVWHAQYQLAICLERQGLEGPFVEEALKAYTMRPSRAEPLHALAKHFRVKGPDTARIAMMFAREGMNIPRPNDRLFVEDWVYEWGFGEEISLAGYYDPNSRGLAQHMTLALAQSPTAPWHVRQQSRNNMAFFLQPLKEYCPSATLHRLEYYMEEGFTSMNPCICTRPNGELEVLVRTVNYKINDLGQYMIGEKGCQDAPIITQNWLVQLNRDLTVKDRVAVKWDRMLPKFSLVIGLEDMRIFYCDGKRCFIACVREQSESGQCEQWTGHLTDAGEIINARRISNGIDTEKNWLPWPDAIDRYVYRLDKLIDHFGDVEKVQREIAVDNISGSSQWLDYNDGFLSVVHESLLHPGTGKRVYQHRFAWISADFQRLEVSTPFVFHDVQIEFCAGLARTPDGKFLISFGSRDAEAWVCQVDSGDVRCMLAL
jgi:glycosyltransferase involved in cell wall biosynthesis